MHKEFFLLVNHLLQCEKFFSLFFFLLLNYGTYRPKIRALVTEQRPNTYTTPDVHMSIEAQI